MTPSGELPKVPLAVPGAWGVVFGGRSKTLKKKVPEQTDNTGSSSLAPARARGRLRLGVAARPTDDHSIDLRQVEQDVFYLGAKPSLGI